MHRDIKPHNLYLATVGKPILLDFGAARRSSGEGVRSISVVLTEGYAPLEQYQRRTAQGPWTDVYGLAATLFRMITGHAPPMALDRLDNDPLESADWGAVSTALRTVLTRALAVQPDERYASAEAFLEALRAWRHATPPPDADAATPASASWPRAGRNTGDAASQPASDDAPAFHGGGPSLPWMVAATLGALALGWTVMSLSPSEAPGNPALGGAATQPWSASAPNPAAAPQRATPAGVRSVEPSIDRSALVALPMVSVPAQTAQLGGSDGLAPTAVRLAAFEITRHEVTVEAFAQFVADQRYTHPQWTHYPCDGAAGGDWSAPAVARSERVPVVCVNLEDAMAYADWRSRVSGDTYRLPSEAEWEAAARAGTRSAYWWGDDLSSGRANCAGCPPFTTRAAHVGRYAANPLGLFDTAGNVREWTCSPAADNDQVSPACDAAPGSAVAPRYWLRGGSWHQPAAAMRSSARDRLAPLQRDHHTGFRLVRQAE